MRSLLYALLFAISCTCLADDAVIPGWQTTSPLWKSEKGGLVADIPAGEYARIVTTSTYPKPDVSMEFRIGRWRGEKPGFAFYWGMKSDRGKQTYDRYQLVFEPNRIFVVRLMPDQPAKILQSLGLSTPAGRWVRLALKYKSGKLFVAIGGKKQITLPLEQATVSGHLAFHTSVPVQIRKLKLP